MVEELWWLRHWPRWPRLWLGPLRFTSWTWRWRKCLTMARVVFAVTKNWLQWLRSWRKQPRPGDGGQGRCYGGRRRGHSSQVGVLVVQELTAGAEVMAAAADIVIEVAKGTGCDRGCALSVAERAITRSRTRRGE